MRMDLVVEEGGGGHKEESKELLPAGEGMEPVEVYRISIIQLPQRCAGQIYVQLIYFTYPFPISVITTICCQQPPLTLVPHIGHNTPYA